MASQDFAPVLQALTAMQSNVAGEQKIQAHKFLETFQKSSEAWSTTLGILSSSEGRIEAKLFAATTLKGKIIYDLDQLQRPQLPGFRDHILNLLVTYREGPRPIRTQLCVCLAGLAIQMIEWKDVLHCVGSALGANAGDCLLEFLRVLPEEVTEGRKINLSEEDLVLRTKELLEDNADQVLQLLISYSKSSASAPSNPHLLDCITSWLREIPLDRVVNSPLLDVIIGGISMDATFEGSVECMSALYRDTRDVDESMDVIKVLYPRLIALQPKIREVAESQDSENFKGITRIFAEAGEAWVLLIARMPTEFRALVEAVLECCARDQDRDAVALTFIFWYEFKQIITVEKYMAARASFADIFAQLVDIMVKHLEFPSPHGPDETDLFDGDREQEEKFREFRHQMGDVLKDCCEVITVTECLNKTFTLIQKWVSAYASQATGTKVPHWQELEAPLFAMRAMGKVVSPEEKTVLPQVIPLIVQIPDHAKLRFQAIMALGRYTEWTAHHPEFLKPQLEFVISGFQHPSAEVVKAAALAFRFFGTDCRRLLRDELLHLHSFYDSVLDTLSTGPLGSQIEITEGVAAVVSTQSSDKIYSALKLYCDPIIERLKIRANQAQTVPDDKVKQAVADTVHLLTIFITNVQPYYEAPQSNQAVIYCQEILPVLSAVAENFMDSPIILEEICRCWRNMVLSYRTAVLPLLPTLADQLAKGFERSRQGCFLWATDSVLREFADGAEFVDPTTTSAIYHFFEQQAFAFLRVMNDLPPQDLPDVIEDFFRLLLDALIYYHEQLIPASICTPILTAAITSLSLEQERPLTITLHYLRDFLSYGTDEPNSSSYHDDPVKVAKLAQLKPTIKQLAANQGEALVQRVLTGMMFTFPRDCLQDASGVLLDLFELMPRETAMWVKATIDLLPEGTIRAGEGDKLLVSVAKNADTRDMRKVRSLLQDFTTSYRRRNVAPREGLGRLEATRFKFSG